MSWYDIASAEAAEIDVPEMRFKRDRELCYIDIETTGLAAARHSIIEIAAIKPGDAVGYDARIKVSKEDIMRADAKALEVNGYSEKLWRDAVPLYDAMHGFFSYINGCDLAGHNICSFDIPFIQRRLHATPFHGLLDGYMSESGYTAKFRVIDTLPLAKFMLSPLGLKKHSLDACLEFLGLERETVHRAIGGARAAARLMEELARLVKVGYSPTE